MKVQNLLKRNQSTDDDLSGGGDAVKTPGVEDRIANVETNFNKMVEILGNLSSAPEGDKTKAGQEAAIKAGDADAVGDDGKPLFNEKQKAVIRNMVSEAAREAVQNVGRETTLQDLALKYDQRTERKFEQLKDKNSEFYKRTQAKIAQMKRLDPHAQSRADLVWSAAHEVADDIHEEKQSRNQPRQTNTRHVVLSNGFVESGSRSSGSANYARSNNTEDVSDRRQQVRSLLGVKEKAVK